MKKLLLLIFVGLTQLGFSQDFIPNLKAPIHVSAPSWVHGEDLAKTALITTPLMKTGVLYWAEEGKPVMATLPGKIRRILPQKNGCFTLLVDHINGWSAKYEGITPKYPENRKVKKAKEIGTICKPKTEDAYFYFELSYKGKALDTYTLIKEKP
ncbi:MAG: hypothetical protein ACI9YL_000489 [Luteibaculaceae bacterium]|jgi:hypothetical protein